MNAWARARRLLASFMVLFAASASAQELNIDSASTRLAGNVYLLDAHIDYVLTPKALDALHNGVPLTLELQIEVTRDRTFLWDEDIASLEQRYQIRYHPLTQQYIVKNLNTGISAAYPSLKAALDALGLIKDFPMLDRSLLSPKAEYRVHLLALLDIEALPAPLRPLAYLSRGWHLSSDWYSWPLKP
jgi:hypothetical protein